MSLVELKNVVKVYSGAGRRPRFELPELRVDEAEGVALVGPSGCGKSTLLNLMAGIMRPDAGEIQVNGSRVDQLPAAAIDRFRGRTFGYVFQEFNLVPALSALENVLLGLRFGRTVARREWENSARQMLDQVGLSHRVKHRPSELSIGEQQRVAVARAMVNQPPIILADEPTGSLDPATANQVFDLLVSLCAERSRTLLVVTHSAELAGRLQRRVDCSGLVRTSSA